MSGNESLTRASVNGTKWTSISVVVSIGAQAGQIVALSRILGKAEMGTVALVLMIAGLCEILTDAGLSNAVIQRSSLTRSQLSTVYWLNVFNGLIVTAVLLSTSRIAADFFAQPQLALCMMIVALGFLAVPHGQQYKALLEKGLNFRPVAISEVVGQIVALSTSLCLCPQIGSSGAAIGVAAGLIVRTVLLNVAGRRLFKPRARMRIAEVRELVTFGAVNTLDSVLNFMSATLSAFVVGRVANAASLAVYNQALNLGVNLPARLNPILMRVAFPALSAINGERARMSWAVERVLICSGLCNTPLLLFVSLNAPIVVHVVLGSEWSTVAPLLSILALVGIGRALGNPMGPVLLALGRVKLGFVINLVKNLITLPLVVVATVEFGSRGAALTLLGVQALNLVINSVLLRRLLDLSLMSYCLAAIQGLLHSIPMIGASILMGAGLRELHIGGLMELVLLLLAAGVTYLATVALTPSSSVRAILAATGLPTRQPLPLRWNRRPS